MFEVMCPGGMQLRSGERHALRHSPGPLSSMLELRSPGVTVVQITIRHLSYTHFIPCVSSPAARPWVPRLSQDAESRVPEERCVRLPDL